MTELGAVTELARRAETGADESLDDGAPVERGEHGEIGVCGGARHPRVDTDGDTADKRVWRTHGAERFV